jgi:t-SNARE complex subunit (syntaxin)
MARKKTKKISKRQKRKIRVYQLIFVAIAFVMIASMVVSLIN